MSAAGPDPETPPGHLRPTGAPELTASVVLGLLIGWSIRPLALRWGFVEPHVSWAAVGLIFFVALIVAGSAYLTRRTVRRARHELDARRAVNRLVLGKACALAGAVIAGGYAGYAVAQLGVGDPMATTRLVRSALATLGAAAVVVASLLLEHACRVPPDAE